MIIVERVSYWSESFYRVLIPGLALIQDAEYT